MNRQAEDIATALSMYGLIKGEDKAAVERVIRCELNAGSAEWETDDERSRRVTKFMQSDMVCDNLSVFRDAEE